MNSLEIKVGAARCYADFCVAALKAYMQAVIDQRTAERMKLENAESAEQ
jgi:hypothetical protein